MNSQVELRDRFWEMPLSELNGQEWERLCDGCGRCCLKKFSDTDSDEVVYTRVVCRYFIEENSSCSCYEERTTLVPDCLDIRSMDLGSANWMPETCAYRLRYENKPLFDWHPLIAGSRQKIEDLGLTITGKVISEQHVHPEGFEEHIIRWVSA